MASIEAEVRQYVVETLLFGRNSAGDSSEGSGTAGAAGRCTIVLGATGA